MGFSLDYEGNILVQNRSHYVNYTSHSQFKPLKVSFTYIFQTLRVSNKFIALAGAAYGHPHYSTQPRPKIPRTLHPIRRMGRREAFYTVPNIARLFHGV